LLIEKGADVNARSAQDATPLHEAARRNRKNAVALLLDHRADINAQNRAKATPLNLATELGYFETAEVLLVRGARMDIFDATAMGRLDDLDRFLKSDPELSFDELIDVTAVDHLNRGAAERYCVVYQLYSTAHNVYYRVKAWVPEDDPSIDSCAELWKSAPWAEREVYDLFGIEFRNHPDLRRLLLPEYYTGHPLRKDYPLTGMGERDHFPKYNRETGE